MHMQKADTECTCRKQMQDVVVVSKDKNIHDKTTNQQPYAQYLWTNYKWIQDAGYRCRM